MSEITTAQEAAASFDVLKFWDALYFAKGPHRTWRSIAREAKVSPSTLTRISQGKSPSADTLARLIRWFDLDFLDYVAPHGDPDA